MESFARALILTSVFASVFVGAAELAGGAGSVTSEAIEDIRSKIARGTWVSGRSGQEVSLQCPENQSLIINFVRYSATHYRTGELVSEVAPRLILLTCAYRQSCRIDVADSWLRNADWSSIYIYDRTLRINYVCETSDVRVAIGCQPLERGHPDYEPDFRNATFTCPRDTTVHIRAAFYGRLGYDVCIWNSRNAHYRNDRLVFDVTEVLKRKCAGRSYCTTIVNPETMMIPDHVRRREPFRRKKKYVIARYVCKPR